MAFDGITAHLLASELNESLAGGRIDKIHQPDKQTVIISVRVNATVKKLLISINPACVRMNITSAVRENPKMPPSFCMLLRKYLSGAKILSVSCPSYERIVELKVSITDELYDQKTYTLICELMGRHSNLVLVTESGKIVDSLIHVDMSVNRYREVMPARIYEYPPAQDKITPDEALVLMNEGKLPIKTEFLTRNTEKALLNSVKGLSPRLCGLLADKAEADDRAPVNELGDAIKQNIIKEASILFTQIISKKSSPCVSFSDTHEPMDYHSIKYGDLPNTEDFNSISEAIDRFYDVKDRFIDIDRKKNILMSSVDAALSHAVRKYDIHRKDIEDGSKADYYKKCGDLILSNAYLIKDRPESFTCQDYYADPVTDITIPLNLSLDPSDNAQEYYKKFHKAKRKLELSSKYIEDDKDAINYFRSLKAAVKASESEEDIEALTYEIRSFSENDKRKERVPQKGERGYVDPNKNVGMAKSGKASSRAMRDAAKRAAQKANKSSGRKNLPSRSLSFRKYQTKDGYEILSGRNNIQNDELTFRTADKSDWWFHVKGLPGTHVILKSHRGEEFPSDEAVLEAAGIAAYFSRSIMIEEHSGNKSIDSSEIKIEVDYCPVSHVKKIPGAKPGMVIYENYYSVMVPAKAPGEDAIKDD